MERKLIDESWLATASAEDILAEIHARDARISDLRTRLETHLTVYGGDFRKEDEAWLAPFISRFTLDDGADGQPDVHLELYDPSGRESHPSGHDLWIVRIGDQLLNQSGELEKDIWFETDDWHPFKAEDFNRLTAPLTESFQRASEWMRLNIDPEDIAPEPD